MTGKNLVCGYTAARRISPVEICRIEELNLLPGTLTALMGANGSGKSTLIQTLSGVIPPLKGKVLIDNRSVSDYSGKALAEQISVVLTGRPDTGFLTVRETAALGSSHRSSFFRRDSHSEQTRLQRSLELTGLESLSHRRASTLSDGEFRRLMIARAMVQDSPLILLDEPLAFLDPANKAMILKLLKNLAESGKTVLFSTHEPGLSLHFANRLLLIDTGGKIHSTNVDSPALSSMIEKAFPHPDLIFDKDLLDFRVGE